MFYDIMHNPTRQTSTFSKHSKYLCVLIQQRVVFLISSQTEISSRYLYSLFFILYSLLWVMFYLGYTYLYTYIFLILEHITYITIYTERTNWIEHSLNPRYKVMMMQMMTQVERSSRPLKSGILLYDQICSV